MKLLIMLLILLLADNIDGYRTKRSENIKQKRHTERIVYNLQHLLPSSCKTECQESAPVLGQLFKNKKCRTTCPGGMAGPFSKQCLKECQGPVDERTELKPECREKCQVKMNEQKQNGGGENAGGGQKQQSNMSSSSSSSSTSSSSFSSSTQVHQFTKMEDCVEFCVANGIGKSGEECRGKCQPRRISSSTSAGSATRMARETIPEVPQLTLNVPIVRKTSETRHFDKLEDCLNFCVEKGIGKSVEECREKCQAADGTLTVFLTSTAFAQG